MQRWVPERSMGLGTYTQGNWVPVLSVWEWDSASQEDRWQTNLGNGSSINLRLCQMIAKSLSESTYNVKAGGNIKQEYLGQFSGRLKQLNLVCSLSVPCNLEASRSCKCATWTLICLDCILHFHLRLPIVTHCRLTGTKAQRAVVHSNN